MCFLITNIYSNYVDEIVIVGNKKTKKSIILNNISHPVNASFNLDLAQKDLNQLSDLECFNHISIENRDSTYYVLLEEMQLIRRTNKFS